MSADPAAPSAARSLRETAEPLPLGPRGWLERQLRLQADGITGQLPEVWADVGPDSGWLGGDGESWERGPYYLDGLVPLAHVLGDETLLATARPWIEWMLASQVPLGEEDADWVEAAVRKEEGCSDITIIRGAVGPTIGAHVGPGMVDLIFWGRNRAEKISLTDRIAKKVRGADA